MSKKLPTRIQLEQCGVSITVEAKVAIEDVYELLTSKYKCIEVKKGYKSVASYYECYHRKIIPADEIMYLKADRAYCKFYFYDHSDLIKSKSLNYFLKEFYVSSLVRIHRGCAVNKTYLKRITSEYVVLCNCTRLPIGRKYKISTFLDFFF